MMNRPGKMIGCFLGTTVFLLIFVQEADAQMRNIRFRHLTIEDGLSQNGVRVIFQDRHHFMWFGTWDGLNRYDGYQFTVYRNDPDDLNSLSDNLIGAIYEDADGIFWIGTGAGGLNRFNPMTGIFTRYPHGDDTPQSLRGNFVLDIEQDQQGFLWIATFDGGLSRFDPGTEMFTHYRHNPDDPQTIASDSVFAVVADKSGILWLATGDGGLTKVDPETGQSTHYQHDPQNPRTVQDKPVRCLYLDQTGMLWVGVKGGDVHRVDPETGEVTDLYPLDAQAPPQVFSIYGDSSGLIWAGTYGDGLYALDPTTGQVSHYEPQAADPESLNDTSVWAVYEDLSGNVWIGTQNGGVDRFPTEPSAFRYFTHRPNDPNSLDDKQVRMLYQGSRGILWIGTAKGLNAFDAATQQFTRYEHDPEDDASLSAGFNFTALYEDQQGILWVGGARSGLNRFDPATQQFEHYYYEPDNLTSHHHTILDIYEDPAGCLWLATDLGLHCFDRETATFQLYQAAPDDPENLSKNHVRKIVPDESGNLWLSSWYSGISKFQPDTGGFQHYRAEDDDPTSLASDAVYALLKTQSGQLWVGTSKGLSLFDESTDSFVRYSMKHGLPNDTITGLLEDDHGNLWVSTNNGLAQFDPRTETSINYDITYGLQSNQFAEGSYYKSAQGELFFGGINGFNAFSPDQITQNSYQPPVVLTDFRLFNKSVLVGADSLLQQPIWETDHLTLSYKDAILSFDFAALNYQFPERNRYQYLLDGFETTWNTVDSTRRSATYTNLPAREYVFRVRGSNNDGVWSDQEVALTLTVTPPWWETWWVQSALVVLIVGLALGGYRWRVYAIQQQNRRLEQEVTKRTKEAEIARTKAEDANRAKSTFLANMSHELRTPLNAILGFSQFMAHNPHTPEEQEILDIIMHSGEHLLTLINQVLELSKIEAGHLTLNETTIDLHKMLNDLENMFFLKAKQKKLQLLFERTDTVPRYIRTDDVKLRQILINLLSNAVKFTEEGTVSLRVYELDELDELDELKKPSTQKLCFEIADTGPGISPEEQDKLFEAFTQTKTGRETQEGTGLGLTISQKFVHLMDGDISVKSEVGQGTTFTFTIQCELVDSIDDHQSKIANRVIALEPDQPRYRILIVDDKPDNRKLLVKLLSDFGPPPSGFELQEAQNGQEAIEIWETWEPHLIWMDLRMPVMDGYEATRHIKSTLKGKQTVIIVLSASIVDEERIAVIAAGCDNFLRKPFRDQEVFDLMHKHLGVRFVYEENNKIASSKLAGSRQKEEEKDVLTPEAFAVLPEELRTELQQAVEVIDMDMANNLIERIRQHNPSLAEALAELVKNYRFDMLQALFEDK